MVEPEKRRSEVELAPRIERASSATARRVCSSVPILAKQRCRRRQGQPPSVRPGCTRPPLGERPPPADRSGWRSVTESPHPPHLEGSRGRRSVHRQWALAVHSPQRPLARRDRDTCWTGTTRRCGVWSPTRGPRRSELRPGEPGTSCVPLGGCVAEHGRHVLDTVTARRIPGVTTPFQVGLAD